MTVYVNMTYFVNKKRLAHAHNNQSILLEIVSPLLTQPLSSSTVRLQSRVIFERVCDFIDYQYPRPQRIILNDN